MNGLSLGPAGGDRPLNPIRATKAPGPPSTPEQRKLMAAAKDFESVMLGMVFKKLRGAGDEKDPLSGGQAGAMYRDMLDDERAKAMASGAGIGLADGIYRQLVQSVSTPDPAAPAVSPKLPT